MNLHVFIQNFDPITENSSCNKSNLSVIGKKTHKKWYENWFFDILFHVIFK